MVREATTRPSAKHDDSRRRCGPIDTEEIEAVNGFVRSLLSSVPGVPLFPTLEGANSSRTVVGGREVLNFAGYSYLGLSTHPAVLDASKLALERFGSSSGGSRLVSGQTQLHVQLERAIAEYLGVDDALVFASGHSTNESVIGHILRPGDVAFVDEFCHNSILQGVRLSGARLVPFAHNDVRRCQMLLSRTRHRFDRALVVIEGLYSMDGDIPEVGRFVELRRRFDVALMIDEAHSFGVIGDGRGVTAHSGVSAADVDILMGTLSKSLASCGGFVAGGQPLLNYLRYTTPGFVFSAAPPPPVVAAALTAVTMLADGRAPLERLQKNIEHFRVSATELGLNLACSAHSPIATYSMGSRDHCARTSAALLKRGLLVQPVMYPAVQRGGERLRFFITAAHTEWEIRSALEILASQLDSETAT